MTVVPTEELPRIYASLMREIKLRLAATEDAFQRLQADPKAPHAFLGCEFCYLQIRRCCELLALTTLLTHNGVAGFRKKELMKEWHAGNLLRMLEGLSDDAFPEPVTVGHMDEDGTADLLIGEKAKENRARLSKIYAGCADKLHVGSLRQLLSSGGKIYETNEIYTWRNFFIRLLDKHAILLPDRSAAMIVFMRHSPDDDVYCAYSTLEAEGRIGELLRSPPTLR